MPVFALPNRQPFFRASFGCWHLHNNLTEYIKFVILKSR